jgi:heat shock transcription factor
MVNDPSTDDMIRWTEDGTSFTVPSSEKFGKEMLPRFFKHSNFGSFVRQLNMYGFHKVPHLQQGVLKHDEGEKEKAEILEFRNDCKIRTSLGHSVF